MFYLVTGLQKIVLKKNKTWKKTRETFFFQIIDCQIFRTLHRPQFYQAIPLQYFQEKKIQMPFN